MLKAPDKTYEEILWELSRTRAFSHLPQDKLENIASLARSQIFPKGSTILAEGAHNHNLYLLLKGTVTVYSGGKMVTRYGRAGDIFGEMSVVAEAPVSATVVANDDVETIVVDGRYVGGFYSHLDHEMVTVFYKLFTLSLLEKLKLTTLKARLFEDAVRHLPANFQHEPAGIPDQTVQKNLTDTLLTSLAVHSADQAIVVADTGGRIVRFNLAAESLFSCIELQVAGEPIHSLCAEGEKTPIFPQVLAGDLSSWSGELDFVTKLGRVFPARTSISVIQDHDGDRIGILSIIQDISGQKNLEQELQAAQKIEIMGKLAGGVAHDFNNLLQVISGNAGQALQKMAAGAPGREELERVLEAAVRGSQLTRYLHAPEEHHSLNREPMDPNLVVAELAAVLGRVLEARIELRVEPQPRLWRINGDRELVRRMLMSLCVRAREALPAGGAVTLETRNATLDEVFCRGNRWAEPGDFVVLSVQADGATPRANGGANGGGKGEGAGDPAVDFAMVLEIVKQHEGFLHVDNAGRVSVYLPRETRKAKGAPRAKARAPAGGTERVLVAEDEPGVLYLVANVLEKAGYRVVTASDGFQALRAFEEQGEDFDLVVLDAVLPGLSGAEVYRTLKEKKPGLRFLFNSGYASDLIGIEFLQANRIPLVAKPFSPDDLLGEVRRVLDAPVPRGR